MINKILIFVLGILFIGFVSPATFGYNSAEITVQTTAGALDDLSDVSVSSPTNAYVLTWNSTSSAWEALVAPGASGGITWANAVNGTLFTQVEWNTNYTANNALWLAGTDTFSGSNYTTFLTHVTNSTMNKTVSCLDIFGGTDGDFCIDADSGGGITWANIINGTVFLQTEWDTNYTTNNALWLADKDNDTFQGNYSVFLTHITNSTMNKTVSCLDIFGGTDGDFCVDADTGGSVTWANVVNGTTFLQSEWDTNYTANNANWLSITNNSYYLDSNPDNFVTNTTMNKTISCLDIFGGSDVDFCADAGASGGITWADATNGTLLSQADWDTNYTTNNVLWLQDNDTFAGSNYSTFLTHVTNSTMNKTVSCLDIFGGTDGDFCIDTDTVGVTWANAVNGTLYKSTNPFGFYNSTSGLVNFSGIFSDLTDPVADTSFNFANNNLSWIFVTPTVEAFTIEATGGFTGDLFHVHQHTGNPSSTNLVHLHAEDSDVQPLLITSGGSVTAINISSGNISLTNGGVYASDWSNVTITESQISDLTHTGITWANVVNGTMFSQADWNTNYTANNANWLLDTDTFSGSNYSTFLTHITWANAVNGTLFTQALWNTNYTTNNALWLADVDTNLTEDDVEGYIFDSDNTANLNMSTYNITMGGNNNTKVCLNQACSRYMFDNGTGIIIQG